MPRPNTFIVGAPKCGTTALSVYLADHPNVFMSSPKEPHHFVHDEMPRKSHYPSLDDYLSLFSNTNDQHLVVAEASVWYLYSETALKNISKFCPHAKIIVMLRRPDEMVYSMHSQAVVTLQENIENFEKAWSQCLANQQRHSFSSHCKEPKLLEYDKIAMYGEQILKAKKYFPDDQMHIIFFEDFTNNTAEEFRRLQFFLDIPYLARDDFKVVNPNTQLRNKQLGAFLKNPPKVLTTITKQTKAFLGISGVDIKKRIRNINQKKIQRPILTPEIRRRIILHYKDDIELLESITKKNLSNWLT